MIKNKKISWSELSDIITKKVNQAIKEIEKEKKKNKKQVKK